ncbi:MAG TPA: DHH family phosphoesterase, partial [Ruminococcaceae bacterium]|nr:DHH family phosphoesterase [Oscillospiraceae bacterium]
IKKDIHAFVAGISAQLDSPASETLTGLSLPVVVADKDGRIVWYNETFRNLLLGGVDAYGDRHDFLFDEDTLQSLSESRMAEIEYDGRYYTVYESEGEVNGSPLSVFYFIDKTLLHKTMREYELSRPAVAIILIDSLDEFLKNARDSERAAITGAVESVIENWALDASNGFIRKLANDRFIFAMEERHLRGIIQNRFEILDKVRSAQFGERGGATLSIGVGRGGATLHDCEDMARAALDMALGRGGDQAAVKTKDTFEFFGGVSKGIEKRTKVRSRVIASALCELIEASENVLIMGHRFADLDAFGSACGLLKAVTEMGHSSKIVMTGAQSLALPLLERMKENGGGSAVIEPNEAMTLITKNTLLIIVDTHRAEFLDSKDVYMACKTVVVIDHHRKTVDYIDGAVIFYHEPFASSASEMVTELLQYMGERMVGKFEAEALLSGIMLDTRNFVLRTGVRTFEASAFLRGRGADPVEVKRLFSGSMEVYKERAGIVANAEIYKDCAISGTDSESGDTRIAASQAADELLSISDVRASFVLFESGGEVNISARSLGDVNVQIIMEALGGGGHQTMAAAQLPGDTFETARQKLIKVIEDIGGKKR